MSDMNVTVEAVAGTVVEVSIPTVGRIATAIERTSTVTVLDKYSIAGLGVSNDKAFVFTQITPQDTWTITHNLLKFPSVTVVDSSNSVVVGDVEYTNENTLVVSFNGGFSGKAYLN
jgi:hypothetical protein